MCVRVCEADAGAWAQVARAARATDEAAAERLWKLSAELTKVDYLSD